MNILEFMAKEMNIAIYAVDTRTATLANMTAALPDMDNTIRELADQSASKLADMGGDDFVAATFTLANDDEPGEAA